MSFRLKSWTPNPTWLDLKKKMCSGLIVDNKNETCNTVLEVTLFWCSRDACYTARDTRRNVEVAPKTAEDFRFVQLEVKGDNAARDVRTGDGTHAPIAICKRTIQLPTTSRHQLYHLLWQGKVPSSNQSFFPPTPLNISAFHLLPLWEMITTLWNWFYCN